MSTEELQAWLYRRHVEKRCPEGCPWHALDAVQAELAKQKEARSQITGYVMDCFRAIRRRKDERVPNGAKRR